VITYEYLLTLPADISYKITFITLGSPLPMYAMKHGIQSFKNIPWLVDWYNITYKNDIYGFSLKPLNEVFGLTVIEDYVLSPMPWSYVPIVGRFTAHSDLICLFEISHHIQASLS